MKMTFIYKDTKRYVNLVNNTFSAAIMLTPWGLLMPLLFLLINANYAKKPVARKYFYVTGHSSKSL